MNKSKENCGDVLDKWHDGGMLGGERGKGAQFSKKKEKKNLMKN